ncbi:MAG: hypothetical protein M0Q45_07180 [Bacteroidales bacterium]|nr:hypothetical protein [Bacteroidales bacterium]
MYLDYFISSTSTIENIKLNKYDQYYYEQLITSFLSNTNSNIYIANGNLSRVEKIKYIADNKLVKKQLYVCAADIYNNAYETNYKKDTTPNCSECIKCKRTIITLDLLGKLEQYSTLFDFNKYQKYKDSLYVEVLANYEKNHFYKDIYELMIETNPKTPNKYRNKVVIYKIKIKLSQIKVLRKIYSLLKKK